MLCVVYRSPLRDQTYLYVTCKDDFSRVPPLLLKQFGKPQFAMMLSLERRQKLARVNIEKLKKALREEGYYLQLPPAFDIPFKNNLN